MIVSRSKKTTKIEIDLTGPQGNAFFLLGTAKNLGKQMGKTNDEVSAITEEMKSGDYENLISVFDREFGEHVVMYR